MPTYHLENLNREAYNASIANIHDAKSLGFAKHSREWWDRHFSWKPHGCITLADASGNHLSYIFYKIDRYHEYLTIHNIFTPHPHRRQGYAKELLSQVFQQAGNDHVQRFRLVSVPKSLPFYTSMGFIYWGIDSQGDYYCNLPLPDDGLEGLEEMTLTSKNSSLINDSFDTIYAKVGGNETLLSKEQHATFQETVDMLGEDYRYEELMDFQSSQK